MARLGMKTKHLIFEDELDKIKSAICDILETALPARKWTPAEINDYARDFLMDLGDDENVEFSRLEPKKMED